MTREVPVALAVGLMGTRIEEPEVRLKPPQGEFPYGPIPNDMKLVLPGVDHCLMYQRATERRGKRIRLSDLRGDEKNVVSAGGPRVSPPFRVVRGVAGRYTARYPNGSKRKLPALPHHNSRRRDRLGLKGP